MRKIRALIPILLLLLWFGTPSFSNPCRLPDPFPSDAFALAGFIRQDLLNGVWQEESGSRQPWESFRIIKFMDGGRAEVVTLTESAAGERIEYQWQVTVMGDMPVLMMMPVENNPVCSYAVEMTCNGVNLTCRASGALHRFRFYPALNAAKRAESLDLLSGKWESSSVGIADAKVVFNLKKDGSYESLLDGLIGKGKWSITTDGRFLLLTNEMQQEYLQIFQIQYLEMDELVLENIGGSQDHFFNRIL